MNSGDQLQTEEASEEVETKIENSLEQKCEELEQQLKRSMADYQNLLRRTQQEREQMRLYAAEPAIKSLIPALDNFYYALKSFKVESPEGEKFHDSLKMIWQNLLASLEQIGCKCHTPEQQTYDASFHEAIGKIPSELPSGTITEVYRPGYTLNERLLKPAQVVVAVQEENV